MLKCIFVNGKLIQIEWEDDWGIQKPRRVGFIIDNPHVIPMYECLTGIGTETIRVRGVRWHTTQGRFDFDNNEYVPPDAWIEYDSVSLGGGNG